jgi:hypothetical protein
VKGAHDGFCTKAEGKMRAGSGRVHVKEGEGWGGVGSRAPCGEKDGGGGVRSSGRPRGRRGRVVVCSALQHGSRGEGGVRSRWPWPGRCHGLAVAHSADFDLNKDF